METQVMNFLNALLNKDPLAQTHSPMAKEAGEKIGALDPSTSAEEASDGSESDDFESESDNPDNSKDEQEAYREYVRKLSVMTLSRNQMIQTTLRMNKKLTVMTLVTCNWLLNAFGYVSLLISLCMLML